MTIGLQTGSQKPKIFLKIVSNLEPDRFDSTSVQILQEMKNPDPGSLRANQTALSIFLN
jgi:hypothetical protein